jgi:transcriptional regulator with XRE-family HTH domain
VRPSFEEKERSVKRAFGQVLRELREERALSQEKLAEMARCHRNNISFLERGEQNPSLILIFNLADALHISPMDLVARVNERAERALAQEREE